MVPLERDTCRQEHEVSSACPDYRSNLRRAVLIATRGVVIVTKTSPHPCPFPSKVSIYDPRGGST